MGDESGVRWSRRSFLGRVGAGALAAAAASGTAAARETPGRDPGPKKDEILVGVTQAAERPRAPVEDAVPGGARIAHENETLNYVAVEFPSRAPAHARRNFVEAVTKRPDVKYAERNATHEAALVPNDPRYDEQYAPPLVDAPEAWDTTLGDASVTVAVVDTGAQYDHPDLAGNFAGDPGYDFADDDTDPAPDAPTEEYHGTHVAGIAAAATDNGTGVAGVSESSLLSARALDETGSGSTSDIADAIQWATDRGADVINLSLGGGGSTSTMKSAVSYAYDRGALVCAAAGNAGRGSVGYPAAYDECLAVSALDPDETLASYSNYGDAIELAAPGTNVLSTTTEARGAYEALSGTSMATPVVSGVAGLAKARWGLSNGDLREHLKRTAEDVGLPAAEQGSGRVDAAAAVGTDPSAGGGGGGGSDGDGGDGGGTGGSVTASASGSLSGSASADCWTRSWRYADPSSVEVRLVGPSDADFDLYLSTGSTACPTTWRYDRASRSPDSRETIVVDDPDASTALRVLVDSYAGSGEYALEITEWE